MGTVDEQANDKYRASLWEVIEDREQGLSHLLVLDLVNPESQNNGLLRGHEWQQGSHRATVGAQ